MDASPKAIREVQFRERLRGYNPDDVDQFLERVALSMDLLEQRLAEATARAERAEEEAHHQREESGSVSRTLHLAQRTADLVLQEAQTEVVQLIEAAEGRADSIVADAEQRARQLVEEAQSHVSADVERLSQARDRLMDEVGALQRYLEAERARAQRCLNEAAVRLETAVPGLSAPPPGHSGDAPSDAVGPVADQAAALGH